MSSALSAFAKASASAQATADKPADEFAALYAPSAPLAALLEVARGFSPRIEACGSIVIIDASGLSRLFGTAIELGTHLHTALATHVDDDPSRARVAIGSTQVTAALAALGRPGLTVVDRGHEAPTIAPFSVSLLCRLEAFRRQTGDGRRQTTEAWAASGASEAGLAVAHTQSHASEGGGWDHPRHTHQASRTRRTRSLALRVEGPSTALRASRELNAEKADARMLDVLTKWGIRTLGELAALPGPEVYERLGGLGVAWQHLARGVDNRPLVPWVDELPFEATMELEWPVEELEPLSFVLARLLEPLSVRLEQADRGAAVLHTALRLTTKAVVTRTLQLPTPMRDPKTLRTLILLDLESHPPDAAVDTVRVFIEPTPGRVVQWTLLDRAQPAPEQVSTLVARLTALMGSGHVGSPRLLDSWRPGAFEMKQFVAPEMPQVRPAEPLDRAEGGLRSALRRFRFPIPARVQMADGRPVRVISDRHGLSSGAIVTAAGPWRTSGEWWEGIRPAEHEVHGQERREKSEESKRDRPVGRVGQVEESGPMRRQVGDDWSSSEHSSFRPSHPAHSAQPWDRDEWDVAMHDGTIYRLSVERSAGQWFLEGIID